MRNLYVLPQKFLTLSVPIVLFLGFTIGSLIDTRALQPFILIATILMIYATMVGFKWSELTSRRGNNVVGYSLLLNFIVIPAIAYVIGHTLLVDEPLLFAGLALSALLPTSGMTISWTMLQKGNVSVAIKLTIIGLLVGSLLTPWYLYGMVGQLVEINLLATFQTIVLIILVPMILGQVTYVLILHWTDEQTFKRTIKPNFAPLSVWSMLFVVFASVSMRATTILENPALLVQALGALILFYGLNYVISTWVAVKRLSRADGIALVNGTVLRNLSISIGLAATSFGAEAALLVTLAFIVQQQSIPLYSSIALNRWFKDSTEKKEMIS
ncbi:arsenic resistance protein [Exiguobacterium sp. SH5S13]|uniref:arsenic resistance protein n=1 Tax=Exiguobacterium TaxID=33986 RepID=UPI0008776056|nr:MULTISPECIES: bile acid:sodium symporter [Exiguobacterium]TCI56222.1 arsenic resistance protein [Exiguobacterium sp. SH5S13]